MQPIIRLDEQLSNKIAAGEVVERPASVVKELVENAIDAKATHVDIAVEEGGLSYIHVVDNGTGISRSDCELAFQRHATSKITNESDLFHVQSLGFRGEALPSIASVSHMEIKTSTGEAAGLHLTLQGGYVEHKQSTSSRQGTDITVTQLFYNTPARLKHLKTVHTELGNITNAVYRLALAHPQVAISLHHNQKTIFQTNGNGDVRQVIAGIYGMNTARKMVAIQEESLDFKISGWLVKPEITRASRQHMMIFINGRYIRNYPISRAILAGYHTLLPIKRFPIVSLHITMDPTLIDVNVHPSKLEARMSKEKQLCQLVEQAVRQTLQSLNLIPEAPQRQTNTERPSQQTFSFDDTQQQSRPDMPVSPSSSDGHSEHRQHENESSTMPDIEPNNHQEAGQPASPVSTCGEHSATNVYINEPVTPPVSTEQVDDASESASSTSRLPKLYPIGQAHGTYILAQNQEGLYIIDQHAAQERIKYEFYREKVGEVTAEVQELLVPLTFEFSSSEAAIIDEHVEDLQSVGIFLEAFGPGTYLVRSHPGWFPEGFEKETIEDMIYQVIEEQQVNVKKLREDAAILMSCKRSIKANQHLRNDEMFALLERLRATIDPFTCPHGRPIVIHFSSYDMEKCSSV